MTGKQKRYVVIGFLALMVGTFFHGRWYGQNYGNPFCPSPTTFYYESDEKVSWGKQPQ